MTNDLFDLTLTEEQKMTGNHTPGLQEYDRIGSLEWGRLGMGGVSAHLLKRFLRRDGDASPRAYTRSRGVTARETHAHRPRGRG